MTSLDRLIGRLLRWVEARAEVGCLALVAAFRCHCVLEKAQLLTHHIYVGSFIHSVEEGVLRALPSFPRIKIVLTNSERGAGMSKSMEMTAS